MDPAPAAAAVHIGIEPEPVHAVIPIERISVVDATESIPPVKPAEAVERDPVTAEVETSETAEVDATKSVEPTKVEATEMASSEVTTTEVTTTEVATAEVATAEVTTTETAGICDLRQCDHSRYKRCGYDRDKLTIHETHSCWSATSWSPQKCSESGEAAAFLVVFIAVPTSTASAARWCRR
jgi:cytoskeletal protein RodZ